MSEATGPAMPNLGSSLVPQQNPETVVIGPTPPMKDSQRMELERYMKRDAIFLSTFEHQRQRQNALMNEKQLEIRQTAQAGIEIFGPGYSPSYGNGLGIPLINGVPANNAFRIVYPSQRRRARKAKEFSFTRTMVEEQAQKEDVLVPIRLDIELDGLVLRDTFTWNLYESHISPEHFAEVLCEDLQFPAHQFAPHVAKAIRDQIQDYHLPALSVEEPLLEDQDQVVATEEVKSAQELRILIKIDITVANTSLIDQFEWDISCPNNDPEHFAEVLAAELGLGGEFRTAIAHSIREQVQTHTKCLNLIGYNYDGSTVHDEDLKSSFLPKITTILREEDAVEQFTPILEKLTEPEIDKLERDRERDKRRKRRQTRGRRGVILPDLEPSKTRRTLMYHGQTLEPTDLQLDLQHNDLTMSNRLGPTTRRATMAHDHAPVGSQVMSAFSLAGQRTPLHHRMTRKLRGSGSDLSVHHVGFAGPGISAPASASSYSRDSSHGPKDKHIAGSREQHAYSPMRETTPVQNSKEGLAHIPPMESRTPQQMGRQSFATTPEPNTAFSPPPPGSGPNRRTTTSTNTMGTPVQTTFVVAENLPKSLIQDQARLHQLYPSDRFEILVRANGVSGEVSTSMDDYRVRCLECPPGKLYNSGPEGTLQNFEVHLKSNRAHRSYVEQKKQRAGGTMPSYSAMPHAAIQQSSQHPMPSSPLNPQQQNQQHHMAHHQQPQRMNVNEGTTDTGLLLAIYAIGILLSAPFFGMLDDRFVSRRTPMLIGLASMPLSVVLSMLAPNFYVFLVARLLQGVASGSVWTFGLALIADMFPAHRLGLQMGKALVGYTLSLMMGPSLGGILYERGGYQVPIIFCFTITLIDFICHELIIEEREEILKALRLQRKREEAMEEGAEVATLRKKERQEDQTRFWRLIKNKCLLGCVIVTACNAFVFSSPEPTVPLHLSITFDLTSRKIGFGAKIVCLVALVACGAFVIVLGLLESSFPMIILLFVIIGTTRTIILMPDLGELSAVVWTMGTGDGFARVYAIFNMAFSIGVLVGPIVCGLVYGLLGFQRLCFAMSAPLFLVILVVTLWFEGQVQKRCDLAKYKEDDAKLKSQFLQQGLTRSKYSFEFVNNGEEEGEKVLADKDAAEDMDGSGLVGTSRAGSREEILKTARLN